MKNFTETPVFLLAVNSGGVAEYELSLVNSLFKDSDVKAVNGKYEGTEEKSYLISSSLSGFAADLQRVKAVCSFFEQRSFLFLDNQRNAYAYESNDGFLKRHYLGHFQSTPVHIAKRLEGYTHDPSTNTYWIIR